MTRLTWHGSMNHIKILWFRFKQCLGTSAILLVEGSFETRLFRHLSNFVFGVRKFRNTKAMRVTFFSKCLKLKLDFKNSGRNREKVSGFWDNCIWIAIVQLSLLRTGYFSSAANVLKSSLKILYVNKRDFCQLNWLCSNQWIWWRCCAANFNSAWERLACCLSKVLLKLDFLHIYLPTFSQSVISEIQKLRGSSFFPKCLKFKQNFKIATENWENVFCFWDNCICIGIVKLSLLRKGYFSSGANVLTSSTKILHVNKREVFKLNWLDSDQWIW